MAVNLQAICRHEIITNIIDGTSTDNGWKVLVVDDEALRVITQCCKMTELMDRSVVIVEDIQKSKQPMQHEAIYLMAPTMANIESLKNDFATRMRYPGIHIHFLDQAPDEIVAALAHKSIKKYIRGVEEHNLSIIPTEAQVFTMDVGNGNGLKQFYQPNANGSLNDVAKHLASLCAALGEYPIVRYSSNDQQGNSAKCHNLARLTQDRLTELKKNSPKMEAGKNKKSQLIILDRNFDLMSPVVHELTYQAAAQDLCNLNGNIYEYTFVDGTGKSRKKKSVLEENDPVWNEFRHEHISQAMQNISTQFKEFTEQQKQNAAEQGKKDAATDLKNLMKNMPQHQEKVAQFSLHISLAERIMKNLTPNVEACTRAEQNMVTGEDKDGKRVTEFIGEIHSVLSDKQLGPFEDGSEADMSRVRALMLCVLATGGLAKEEIDRVMEFIPMQHRSVIYNLDLLGVNVVNKKKQKNSKQKRRKREATYELSRWVPIIKDICEDIIEGSLDVGNYPSVTTAPQPMIEARGSNASEAPVQSARKKKNGKRGGWAHKNTDTRTSSAVDTKAPDTDETRNRIIVFIPGAIGYNEIRAAYELTEIYGIDVIIGSHSVTAPNQFVRELRSLNTEEPSVPLRNGTVSAGSLTITKGSTLSREFSSEEVSSSLKVASF